MQYCYTKKQEIILFLDGDEIDKRHENILCTIQACEILFQTQRNKLPFEKPDFVYIRQMKSIFPNFTNASNNFLIRLVFNKTVF